MNISHVISRFEKNYPGKNIFRNNPDNPTEILCEIEPASMHPEFSIVISVIDTSAAHYHNHITETYTVLEGSVILHIGKEEKHLQTGDSYTIPPKIVHWAEGQASMITCTSVPGWTPADHIIIS